MIFEKTNVAEKLIARSRNLSPKSKSNPKVRITVKKSKTWNFYLKKSAAFAFEIANIITCGII
jgi:hypothetical protein